MRVSPQHHFYLYWSSDSFFHSEEMSRVMTHKRFQDILEQSAHECHHHTRNSADDYDRLWRVRRQALESEGFDRRSEPAFSHSVFPVVTSVNWREYDFVQRRFIARAIHATQAYQEMGTGNLIQCQVNEGNDLSWPPDVTLDKHIVFGLLEDFLPGTQLYFNFTTISLVKKLIERSIVAEATVRTYRNKLKK